MNNKPLKILPTNDLLFQHIFGKVGNEEITKDFLEKLLGIKIVGLTLDVNKRMQGEWLDDKIGRLDVKAKLDDGTVVTIEIQVAKYTEMAERLLIYWSQVYTENLKRGDTYKKLNRVISILITVEDMKFSEGIEKYHTIWNLKEKDNPNKIFSKNMEIHVIELKKFDKRRIESPEDSWIKFINTKKEGEMEELKKKVDEEIAKAIKEFEKLVDDPEHHEEYLARENDLRDKISFLEDARDRGIEEGFEKGKEEGFERGKTEGFERGKTEGFERGKTEGFERGKTEGFEKGKTEGFKKGETEGFEKGENEKQIEITKKMLQEGIDIEIIMKCTRFIKRRN